MCTGLKHLNIVYGNENNTGGNKHQKHVCKDVLTSMKIISNGRAQTSEKCMGGGPNTNVYGREQTSEKCMGEGSSTVSTQRNVYKRETPKSVDLQEKDHTQLLYELPKCFVTP